MPARRRPEVVLMTREDYDAAERELQRLQKREAELEDESQKKGDKLEACKLLVLILVVCVVQPRLPNSVALSKRLLLAPRITPFLTPSSVGSTTPTLATSTTSSLNWADLTCSACNTYNPLLATDSTNMLLYSGSSSCLQHLVGQVWQGIAEQPIDAALQGLTTASTDLGLSSDLQDKLAAWVATKSAQVQVWHQELKELLDPTRKQHQQAGPVAHNNNKLWVQQAHSAAGNLWLHSSKAVQEPLAALVDSLSASAQQLLDSAADDQDISAVQAAQLSAVVQSKMQETLQEASIILQPAQPATNSLQDSGATSEASNPASVSRVPDLTLSLLHQCATDPSLHREDAAAAASTCSTCSTTEAASCSTLTGMRSDSHKLLKAVTELVNSVDLAELSAQVSDGLRATSSHVLQLARHAAFFSITRA